MWRYTVYIRKKWTIPIRPIRPIRYTMAVGSDRPGMAVGRSQIGIPGDRPFLTSTLPADDMPDVQSNAGWGNDRVISDHSTIFFCYERWVDDGKDLFRLDSTWLNGLTILRIVFWSMFSVSLIVNPMIHFKVKQQGKPFILQPLAEWLVLGGWERLRTTWSQGGRWFSSNRNPPFGSHPRC